MMSGLSLAKSARANQTSAISLLAVDVVTSIRLPLHLLEVVDVGRPADHAGEALVGVERGRRLEGVLRELELRLRPAARRR